MNIVFNKFKEYIVLAFEGCCKTRTVSSEIYDLCEISDQACRVTYFARVGAKYMSAC